MADNQEQELTPGEMAALSDDGLKKLMSGGSVADLDSSDLRRLSGQPEPGWFESNPVADFVGKAGEFVADTAGRMYGAATELSSDTVRMNALRSMVGEGKITHDEMKSGKVKPGFGEQMAAASNAFLENAFEGLTVKEGGPKERRTGNPNPQILADSKAMSQLGYGLTAINAAAMVKGKAFTWGEGNAGVLDKLGDTVSTAEQMVARGAVGVLSGIGSIPRDDAIELLSQTQVHGSDLVDYFWVPKTATETVMRGMLGLAADVVLDPFRYLTFGAGPVMRQVMKGGAVKIGNRIVTDPMLMARAERQALLAQNDVLKLVTESGAIKNVEMADDALTTMAKAVSEKGMSGLDGELIAKFSKADPELGKQVGEIVRSRQTEKGLIRSLADRETSLNFGIRLPLTNIGIEQQVPLFGHGTRWGAEAALGVKDWSFNSASRVVGSLMERPGMVGDVTTGAVKIGGKIGDAVSSGYQMMKTFTTRPLWDMSSNNFINKKAGNSTWAARQVNEAIAEAGNDPETSDLMVKWLNQEPTLPDQELLGMFGDAEKSVTQAADLAKARELSAQTMARLEMKNPKAAERVRLIRQQLNEKTAEMKKRNIPFNVLNPFDETIPVEERAMGYFPHILNPDYIDDAGNAKYAAAKDAWSDHMAEMGMVDRTQVGRADRRSTHTIIESFRKATGIKDPLFVNDPITASYSRMQDMDNLIAQHDFFNEIWPMAVVKDSTGKLGAMAEQYKESSAAYQKIDAAFIDKDPGRGFVKMDWKNYASPVFKKAGGPATTKVHLTEDMQAKAMIQFKSFLPTQYQSVLKEGGSIFFPEDVATRLNYVMQREKGGVVRQSIDAYNYLFRNQALFGTGYQGMNTFGNLTTHMLARGDLHQIPMGSKFLWDARNNSAKIRDKIYSFGQGDAKISMRGEELYDTMADLGVLGGSQVFEAKALVSDILDNVATTRLARRDLWDSSKRAFDVASFYKANRFLAEQNDNIFRVGLFFDSLEKGYTLQGAKERVGMYFYDFRDMPKGQRAMSRAIPFSSFGMKTAESLAMRAKKLDLSSISKPYYVKEILDGAFVDSYEERQVLRSSLPGYANDWTFGDALPGGRQLMMELPFIANSLKAFMNPLDNLHPLIQALSLATAASTQADAPQDAAFEAARLDSATFQSKWDDFMGTQLMNLIPPSIKMGMTLKQIRNPDEIRSLPLDFVGRLKVKTMAEASGSKIDQKLTTNAQQFGKFMREQSPDWLYNSLMFGQFKNPGLTDQQLADKDAIYGNFMKARMRDISFGLVRINDMDRTILTRMAAVQRQIQKTKKNLAKLNIDANVLRDPMASPELMLKKREHGDKMTIDGVAELQELYRRNAALGSFYAYYLMQEKSGGMLFDMVRKAMEPEKPLTATEAEDQNNLMRMAPAMEAGRIKGLELRMEGQ